MYKLIIFDLDGTLVEKWTDSPLPGVAEFFQRANLPPIAIATNQGGVGLGYWMHKDDFGNPDKYPTENETIYKLIPLARQLGARLYVCFAYQSKKGNWSPVPESDAGIVSHSPGDHKASWEQDWRKPSPGMLLQAMADAGVSPTETLMVGDMESDRLAAEAAGCAFAWADDFFKRTPRVQPDAASQQDDRRRGG